MKKFYCNGKKGICTEKTFPYCPAECEFSDNTGGEYIEVPITNADRIRAMSDIELRDFLQSRVWICETHKLCDYCPMYHEEVGCLSVLEWLKQPADMRGEEDG